MVNSPTKKTISIGLLIASTIPWLFVLVFHIREQVIHHRMEERLEASMIHHTVTIADNEIHWEEKDREIWVDGKLFDIKSSHSENGVTHFTGLYDDEETILKKQLKENLDRNGHNDKHLISQLISSLQQLFFEEYSETTGIFFTTRSALAFDSQQLPFPFCDISTPPPQVV